MDKRKKDGKNSVRFKRHKWYDFLFQDSKFGTWYFVTSLPDGSRAKQSLKTKSVNEALEKANELKAKLFGEKLNRIKSGVKVASIESLYHEFMEWRRLSGKVSVKTALSSTSAWMNHMVHFWKGKTTEDWNHRGILEWETWFLKNRPNHVYFNIRKYVVMFQLWMFENKYITEIQKIEQLDSILKKSQRREKVGRVFSNDEIKALIDHASSNRFKLIISLAALTGARQMEIVRLKKEDIFFDSAENGWVIKYWSTKNGKYRDVGLPLELLELVKTVMNESESMWMFPAKHRDSHIPSQILNKEWSRIKKVARISRGNIRNQARFHDLRHTFATMTAENGWQPKIACEILDMNLSRYDKVYTHVSRAAKINMMKAVSLGHYFK